MGITSQQVGSQSVQRIFDARLEFEFGKKLRTRVQIKLNRSARRSDKHVNETVAIDVSKCRCTRASRKIDSCRSPVDRMVIAREICRGREVLSRSGCPIIKCDSHIRIGADRFAQSDGEAGGRSRGIFGKSRPEVSQDDLWQRGILGTRLHRRCRGQIVILNNRSECQDLAAVGWIGTIGRRGNRQCLIAIHQQIIDRSDRQNLILIPVVRRKRQAGRGNRCGIRRSCTGCRQFQCDRGQRLSRKPKSQWLRNRSIR